MKTAPAIIAAEARAERAEAAALEKQVELAITRARLAEMETEAANRQDAEATSAVRQLVSRGAIKPGDTFNQHFFKAQFLADTALIPLCLCKPFNNRRRP